MVLQTDKDHVIPGSFHVLQPKNPSRIFLDLRTRSQLCPRRHCRPTPATFSSLHRLPCLAFNTAFINQLLSQPPAPRSPAEAGPWHPATGREAGRGSVCPPRSGAPPHGALPVAGSSRCRTGAGHQAHAHPTPPAWRHTTLKTGRLEHGCFQGKQL